MKVIREILQPNLEARPNQPDGSNQLATHRGDLMAKGMFDPCANAPANPVVVLLLSSERLIAIPFPGNLRTQPCGFEVGFNLDGSVDRVGPDIPAGLRRKQNLLKDLTIMPRRIGDCILPNQLMRLIHVHMVFVTGISPYFTAQRASESFCRRFPC